MFPHGSLLYFFVPSAAAVERRADGGKARFVYRAAILRRLLGIRVMVAAPCGGDICQGSFHGKRLHSYCGQPIPRPFQSWKGGGSRESIPAAWPKESIAAKVGQGRSRRTRRCLRTLDGSFTAMLKKLWRRGIEPPSYGIRGKTP